MWRCSPLLLVCLLALAGGARPRDAASAQSGCRMVYDTGNGWAIELCASDPNVAARMDVVMDGVTQGDAALVRIYHLAQSWPGTPQVAIIYASGFVRLRPSAEPAAAVPFGGSFVLGPAYWPDTSTYYHNSWLTRLEIDTTWLPSAPLRIRAAGTNHDLAVTYAMALPPPRDHQTRLHVTQAYTATASIAVDPTRHAEHQGFKLVQVSSMFINEGGACDGGHSDCHDSNAARYIGADLSRRQSAFRDRAKPGFIFDAPQPLGSTWLDTLHTDDQGWQGNTPNLRIALDALPGDRTITPQGWIGATANPNDDNAGLWLHDDSAGALNWQAGQSAQVGYWLLAQDNPPEPWNDLQLRSGHTFLNFEGSSNCFPVLPADRPVAGAIVPIAGYVDTALQLRYDLGSGAGNWAQVRCNFDPPLDLAAYDHLRLDWRGDGAAANSLEVGLITPGAGGEQIFARGYHHVAHHGWWGQLVIPFTFLAPWTAGSDFDPRNVSALFVSVVKDPADDTGGAGSIAIDNLSAFNAGARAVLDRFETVSPNRSAAAAAAKWLATQQRTNGLLKSWEEEPACLAHTYDQALALIVFAQEGMWTAADALVAALATAQNPDGSWFQTRDCSTFVPALGARKWEGDIAWATYALGQYRALGGRSSKAALAITRAADWLMTRISPDDGCLVIDHTEATIDAWWALQVAGPAYRDQAAGLKSCLLMSYWDAAMGRLKGGKSWWQPYLDNQTWGAAFLRAVGEEQKALRALSYAHVTLRTPSQGGQLFGFDGQGGPWSVWNEGAGQYAAGGGVGANDLFRELLAQQREDGAMPSSPDDFLGGGVWTTRWHGVAPTAWLYFAASGGPFRPSDPNIYLPLTRR